LISACREGLHLQGPASPSRHPDLTMTTNTTPELAPLAQGAWQFSKKRQASIMARYQGLRVEWSDLLSRAPLDRADYERWVAVDQEIAHLELVLVRQHLALKTRASRRAKTSG